MNTMRQPEGSLGEDALLEIYRTQSESFPPAEALAIYGANINQFMAQSWPPQPSWNETFSPQSPQLNWQAAPPASDISTQEAVLYPSETSISRSPRSKFGSAVSFNVDATPYTQHYVRPINHVSPDYRSACHSQTPQPSVQTQPLYTNGPTSNGTEYAPQIPQFTYDTGLHPKYDAAWTPIGNEVDRSAHVTLDSFPALRTPQVSSEALALDWSTTEQASGSNIGSLIPSYQAIIPKRKHTSPEAVAKKSKSTSIENELDDFVVVFENAPGALATLKRRRKLDAPVRKAARDVRKAGACHQCRFRKRTVSQPDIEMMTGIRLIDHKVFHRHSVQLLSQTWQWAP